MGRKACIGWCCCELRVAPLGSSCCPANCVGGIRWFSMSQRVVTEVALWMTRMFRPSSRQESSPLSPGFDGMERPVQQGPTTYRPTAVYRLLFWLWYRFVPYASTRAMDTCMDKSNGIGIPTYNITLELRARLMNYGVRGKCGPTRSACTYIDRAWIPNCFYRRDPICPLKYFKKCSDTASCGCL